MRCSAFKYHNQHNYFNTRKCKWDIHNKCNIMPGESKTTKICCYCGWSGKHLSHLKH